MGRTVSLETPLGEGDVRALRLDDEVFLTGSVFAMAYSWQFAKAISMAQSHKRLPMSLENAAIIHCPASYRKEDKKCQIRFIGVTTSSKLNQYTPELIKMFKIRCIIGKGGMDRATLEAMKEHGCVYLAMPGGCSALYTPSVKAVREHWPQPNWADNVLELSVDRLGPLLVAMDSRGESIYEKQAQLLAQTDTYPGSE
jgi:fumarate hydratase subunit beta